MQAADNRTSTEKSKPPAISALEIVLICSYALAVWLIPVRWLDSAAGAAAVALASKVNIYLSAPSVAYARDPDYFTHCHVLASLFAPCLLPLIVRRNGGLRTWAELFRQRNKAFGAWWLHFVFSAVFFALAYFGMYLLADYPIGSRGERAIWISAIAFSAFALAGTLAIGIGYLTMIPIAAARSPEKPRSPRWPVGRAAHDKGKQQQSG